MRSETFELKYRPLISIVMPVYNIAAEWFQAAINSVLSQTYPCWELCIADDGSTVRAVDGILESWQQNCRRIKVIKLQKHQGIAKASNAALKLATGEFVGFLDHDDELAPEALFEIVKILNTEQTLDLIYTDHDKIASDGQLIHPSLKPGFSADLLLTQNYISHFCVFRHSLLKVIGGFRPGFDGSQDYDILLRFVEMTQRIAHIPKVLYHWRIIPGSAAGDINAKPYAYQAARKALSDALSRRGLKGSVEIISPGNYRVGPEKNNPAKMARDIFRPVVNIFKSNEKK